MKYSLWVQGVSYSTLVVLRYMVFETFNYWRVVSIFFYFHNNSSILQENTHKIFIFVFANTTNKNTYQVARMCCITTLTKILFNTLTATWAPAVTQLMLLERHTTRPCVYSFLELLIEQFVFIRLLNTLIENGTDLDFGLNAGGHVA